MEIQSIIDSQPPLRNPTYQFLNGRAMDFLRERMPGVPRRQRRAAANEIARRFMKRMKEEGTNASL